MKYVKLKKGERQYDDIDLKNEHIVDARYVEAGAYSLKGNQLIEALPKPYIDPGELMDVYRKSIHAYKQDEIKKMTQAQKIEGITELQQLRCPLPFNGKLESTLHKILCESYQNRYLESLEDVRSSLVNCIRGEWEKMPCRSVGDVAASATTGLSLLGVSGCGKSAAIKILTEKYPKAIRHKYGDDSFIQIPCIVVSCQPNSNFSALMDSIGRAIDRIMGNVKPTYEGVIKKRRNITEKTDEVIRMIECLNIGCLILDEIQLLNFSANTDKTYEHLLRIVNETKVALFVIGTEDAYDKMFKNLRMGRRVGITIEASEYCNNYSYFKKIVEMLEEHQWFNEHIKFDESIVKGLYKHSKGIMAILVLIYQYMQIDYVFAKVKPTIDAAYVDKVVNKYMAQLITTLNKKNKVSEQRRKELIEKAQEDIQNINIDSKELAKFLEENIGSNENIELERKKENVIDNVLITCETTGKVFNRETVRDVVDKVLIVKRNKNKDEIELSKMVYDRLKDRKDDRRKGYKKGTESVDITI